MFRRSLRIAAETAALIALGLGLGLSANAMNSMGLAITTDHFKQAKPAGIPIGPGNATPGEARPSEDILAKMDHSEVVDLFQSGCYLDERCVFVDARDDDHYEEGHIPGAFQLDHYRVGKYMEEVRPVCQNAERIVVYCNGGKCEDSFLAAGDLLEEGIEMHKIFVYGGGITAWKEDNLPVECGARNSEDLVYLDD